MRKRSWVVTGLLPILVAACGTRVDTGPSSTAAPVVPSGSNTAPVAPVSPGSNAGTVAPGTNAAPIPSGSQTVISGTGGGPVQPATGPSVTSATGSAPVQPATGPPLVLGAVGTETGLIGGALQPSWDGLLAWEQWINTQGGIDGRPVKIIIGDDGGDPGKNAALTSQFIEQYHVPAFVGDMAALTMSGGTPVLAQYGVPAIGGESTDSGWFSSPYAFPLYGSLPSIPIALGKWAPAHLTQRKAAIFYVNEAAAAGQGAGIFEQLWKAGGGQVVLSAGVSIAQPDFTAEVLEAKNAGADVDFIFMEDASCTRFFDAASRQQYHPIYLTIGCSVASVEGGGTETQNRTYLGGEFRPPVDGTPEEQLYLQVIKEYAPQVSPYEGLVYYGWLSGRLFQLAVAAAHGVVTSAALINGMHQLKNVTFGGIMAPYSWGPGDHPPGRCGVVSEFTNQGVQLVTPNFLCG